MALRFKLSLQEEKSMTSTVPNIQIFLGDSEETERAPQVTPVFSARELDGVIDFLIEDLKKVRQEARRHILNPDGLE